MKNPKTLLTTVGILVLIGVGLLFFRGPKPIIEIKAETLVELGPLGNGGFFGSPITNTYVASVLTVIVVIVLGYLAARKASIIPGGLQNLVEAILEAGYNVCVSAAGEKNGRRFFPVFMTIFIFVWVANWMSLLPVFNTFGEVETVSATEFHKQATVLSKSAGILVLKPSADEVKFDVDLSPCTFNDATAAAGGGSAAGLAEKQDNCVLGQRALSIVQELQKKTNVTVADPASCPGEPGDKARTDCLVGLSEDALTTLKAQGKQVGLIAPYLRSMNTDVNSPLSIAIMSAIFVEFWGISALGVFKYGKRFIDFSSPIKFFVGFLETIAELARLISFTFRLFGNVLAGDIILLVMTFLLPFVVAVPFYGLELFFGMIQAFIFAMLTLVFGVLAVASHDDGHAEHEPVEVNALH